MTVSESYYAHGKLLITGEYAVLDGALALAIPCKKGQHLTVTSNANSPSLFWNSIDINGDSWFTAEFSPEFEIIQSSDIETAITLQKILISANKLSDRFLKKALGKKAETKLEFDRNWGLGSSSTLIHLIAQWAEINPFHLLQNSFGGSGYDIACADAKGPILYQIGEEPKINPIVFNPSWTSKLHFVYLGKKQVSSQEIEKYSELKFDRKAFVQQVNSLTKRLIDTVDFVTFINILKEHEQLLSTQLGYTTIKEERFSNISGSFKSLGAWGGDFVLFAGEDEALQEIKKLGYTTIVPWGEMLISPAVEGI